MMIGCSIASCGQVVFGHEALQRRPRPAMLLSTRRMKKAVGIFVWRFLMQVVFDPVELRSGSGW